MTAKHRITVDQVLADPAWAQALYLQGLRPEAETDRGRRHLTGAGLRRAAVEPEDDRYAWTTTRRTP
ncbi:hypothetical protein ACIRPH_31540 [Nocardiopsis sp. NPDC101807]|uniref:hypothetical protein n=1 Tax=Nocardiopsis sp. NPDC101807 TaxID=3364339 RepID=UPI0037F8436D